MLHMQLFVYAGHLLTVLTMHMQVQAACGELSGHIQLTHILLFLLTFYSYSVLTFAHVDPSRMR